MAIELQPTQVHTGEVHSGAKEALKLLVDAGRHRCTVVLRGVKGELSVMNGQNVIPVKMLGISNDKKYSWVTFETNKKDEKDGTDAADQPKKYVVEFQAEEDGSYEAYGFAGNMEIPNFLRKTLHRPLRSKETGKKKTKVTDKLYGPIFSPWGNAEQDPQFDGPDDDPEFYRRQGFFHLGHDIEAEEGDEVVAVADGEVVRVGDSGGAWGHYVVVEHMVNGQIFSATYEHLQSEGRPPEKDAQGNRTKIKAGDLMGKIIKMTEPGEKTHLHISMHLGKFLPWLPPEERPKEYIWTNRGAAPFHFSTVGNYVNMGNDDLFIDGEVIEDYRQAA